VTGYRYVMTKGKLNRRKNRGSSTKCHAPFCGKEIKVGDRVVAKQVGEKSNIWHEDCYDKVMGGVV